MSSQETKSGWRWWPVGIVLALGVGIGLWYAAGRTLTTTATAHEPHRPGEPAKAGGAVRVEVVRPSPGGLNRNSVEPGTVEPFESADIYAKVSGFLAEQTVDIGDRVKKGDVLAKLFVPEYEKQVARDQARVRDTEAHVKQSEARVEAARADAKAAEASVALAKAMVRAKTAYRQYREKQLNRIKELAAQKAVDARLVDEQEDFYLSALEAENQAREEVNTSQEKANAARAKIDSAQADLDAAKADVGVAQAELAKAQVFLDYTVIKAPYTGVITRRSFFPGDFIKSADQGGNTPLLAVERTDKMRVVVQVPDRDVPYIDVGDQAVVEIDALPGVTYKTDADRKVVVSRWSNAEDPATRTVRTEVDIENPDGKLRHGMYGRVTLILSTGTPGAVHIPSGALVGKAEGGRGTVRVLKDGKVHLVPVRYSLDNGVEAEIVSGLTAEDQVIVRANGPVEEGTPVTVDAPAPAAGH
jgi:RND family efflux transporter MFP subunit